jgi:hypothetical protein
MSVSEILRFYLPLVLTSQLMTLSVPLINLGLGRVDNPKLALAGYAVGFSVSVFLNAPVLSARTVTAGLVRDPASHRVVKRFIRRMALLLSAGEALMAVSPLGDVVFQGLLGAPPDVAWQARITLLLQSPIPVFLGERGLYQGVALAYRRTALITVSTVARLSAITISVAGLALWFRLPGAAAGALALTSGIGLEALFIRLAVRRRLGSFAARPTVDDPRDPVTIWHVVRFAWPLILNTSAWAMQRGLINAIIARLADPLTALATFAVVQPLYLFIGSPLFGIQSTVQVLPRHRGDLGKLAWFTAGTASALSLAILLVTGVAGAGILSNWYRLEERLVLVALPALAWIWLEPFLLGFRAFGQGLLLRIRETGPIAFSAAGRVALVSLLGAALVSRDPAGNGALIGVVLLLAGDGWDMLVACVWGLRSRSEVLAAAPEGRGDRGGGS